jgi:hypothetical protein
MFRNRLCKASCFFSFESDPCFLFITLYDKDLISYFGEEISIKSDCEHLLPRKDDTPLLVELRQAILSAAVNTPEFREEKEKVLQRRSSKRGLPYFSE